MRQNEYEECEGGSDGDGEENMEVSSVASGSVSGGAEAAKEVATVDVPFEPPAELIASLRKTKLLAGCDEYLLDELLRRSTRIKLAPAEQLHIEEDGPLLCVAEGSTVIFVGVGPAAEEGIGTIINSRGLLQLDSTVHESVHEVDRTYAYQLVPFPHLATGTSSGSSSPPTSPARRMSMVNCDGHPISPARRMSMMLQGEVQSTEDSYGALFNLCPLSKDVVAPSLRSSSKQKANLGMSSKATLSRCTDSGRLPFVLSAGEGGARLLAISNELLFNIMAETERVEVLAVIAAEASEESSNEEGSASEPCDSDGSSVADPSKPPKPTYSEKPRFAPENRERFQEASDDADQLWEIVQSWCVDLFPGAPMEVAWALTEIVERHSFEPGEEIVSESDKDDIDSLYLITEGRASVEKLEKSQEGGESVNWVMAHLATGAIIGDPAMMGYDAPRAATLRASTLVGVLKLPWHQLMLVYRRFPGMFACLERRLRQLTSMIHTALPKPSEAIFALRLFAPCDRELLEALACAGERRVFYCGKTVQEKDSLDRTLFVMEYGLCGRQTIQFGELEDVRVGMCFGHLNFLGVDTVAPAVVRVMSPLAVILVLTKNVFNSCLTRYPSDRRHFERPEKLLCISREGVPPNVSVMNRLLADGCSLFLSCGYAFVEALSLHVERRCYMPKQTLCVEGTVDDAAFFIQRGGKTCVERPDGVKIELGPGATFGDLAMLGVVRRRTATIRAVTYCFTAAITREALVSLLDKFPSERTYFERMALDKMGATQRLYWPFLQGLEDNVSYALNLLAERRMCPPNLPEPINLQDSALLLLHGEMFLHDEEDQRVGKLAIGECFNEQSLLGISDPNLLFAKRRLRPKTLCEVQLVTKPKWDMFLHDHPDVAKSVRQCIITEMARKAEKKLGFDPGSLSVLRFSALFRAVSEECAEQLRGCLVAEAFMPGEVLMRESEHVNPENERMLFMLDGEAHFDLGDVGEPAPTDDIRQAAQDGINDDGDSMSDKSSVVGLAPKAASPYINLLPGQVYGETVVAGVAKQYSNTIRATTVCLVHVLYSKDVRKVLGKHPKDQRLFDIPLKEAELAGREPLIRRLPQNKALKRSNPGFVAEICRGAANVFFAGGEIIYEQADPSALLPYVLFAGRAVIENDFGVIIGHIDAGELLGAPGWLGKYCSALGGTSGGKMVVRASKEDGIVHCAKLSVEIVQSALLRYPAELPSLMRIFKTRVRAMQEFSGRRFAWIKQTSVPALSECSVFKGFTQEALTRISMSLSETTYKTAEVVTTVGEFADSMLLILEGRVEVRTREGTRLGYYSSGACIGEEVALNLFDARMENTVAVMPCRIIEVRAETIWSVLLSPELKDDPSMEKFQNLHNSRREQVKCGFPMTALGIGMSSEDVCTRAIALQSERIDLAPGELWIPALESSPAGAHYAVIVRGRAQVEISKDNQKSLVVSTLLPTWLLTETMFAEKGFVIRAETAVEAYRFRSTLVRIAAESMISNVSSTQWFDRFDIAQRNTFEKLSGSLASAYGAVSQSREHPDDRCLREWKVRRQKAIQRAGTIKQERAHQLESRSFCRPSQRQGVRRRSNSEPQIRPPQDAQAPLGPSENDGADAAPSVGQLPGPASASTIDQLVPAGGPGHHFWQAQELTNDFARYWKGNRDKFPAAADDQRSLNDVAARPRTLLTSEPITSLESAKKIGSKDRPFHGLRRSETDSDGEPVRSLAHSPLTQPAMRCRDAAMAAATAHSPIGSQQQLMRSRRIWEWKYAAPNEIWPGPPPEPEQIIQAGDRVQVREDCECQPDGKDYYKEFDIGTVTRVYTDEMGEDKVNIKWERTGRGSNIIKRSWNKKFQFASEATELEQPQQSAQPQPGQVMEQPRRPVSAGTLQSPDKKQGGTRSQSLPLPGSGSPQAKLASGSPSAAVKSLQHSRPGSAVRLDLVASLETAAMRRMPDLAAESAIITGVAELAAAPRPESPGNTATAALLVPKVDVLAAAEEMHKQHAETAEEAWMQRALALSAIPSPAGSKQPSKAAVASTSKKRISKSGRSKSRSSIKKDTVAEVVHVA